MLETLKSQLWDLLKQREVSLAMIYDKNGKILWHRGRTIIGQTVFEGSGFPRSLIRKTLNSEKSVSCEDVQTNVFGDDLSKSARILELKSVVIEPIEKHFFLYVDSGTRMVFDQKDLGGIKTLGEVMCRFIHRIERNGKRPGTLPGKSPFVKELKDSLPSLAITDEPVFITGETGVGKNYLANLIHRFSGREGRFIEAEVSSIPANLFESTLFGHRRGSFTDAREDREGLIHLAEGGTLMIDEITEIPSETQAKLLRFLDTRRYRVVGETHEKQADVRIIAATNNDLTEVINGGKFRKDLYYRLQVFEIHIPPLRERIDDVKDFIAENLDLFRGKAPGRGFWKIMLKHDWRGNFREIINVMKRAGILLPDPVTGNDIKKLIIRYSPSGEGSLSGQHSDDLWGKINSGRSFWEVVKEPFLKRDLNREQVKNLISEGLEKSGNRYTGLLKTFNVQKEDYNRFMSFLKDHNLK